MKALRLVGLNGETVRMARFEENALPRIVRVRDPERYFVLQQDRLDNGASEFYYAETTVSDL